MDFLDRILGNPLLTSIIIFPLGNIMLAGTIKVIFFPKTNPGQLMKDLLQIYRDDVKERTLMNERLEQIDGKVGTVNTALPGAKATLDQLALKLETVNANVWDFRRIVDHEIDETKEHRVRTHEAHTRIIHYLEEAEREHAQLLVIHENEEEAS